MSFESQRKHMYASPLLMEAFPAAPWKEPGPRLVWGHLGEEDRNRQTRREVDARPLLSGQPGLSPFSLTSGQRHHFPFFSHLSIWGFIVTSYYSGFTKPLSSPASPPYARVRTALHGCRLYAHTGLPDNRRTFNNNLSQASGRDVLCLGPSPGFTPAPGIKALPLWMAQPQPALPLAWNVLSWALGARGSVHSCRSRLRSSFHWRGLAHPLTSQNARPAHLPITVYFPPASSHTL